MKSITNISEFPAKTWDKIRYADTDRQGHVNNAVFSTFFETGRVEILYGDRLDPDTADISFVIASLQIDFLAEVTWPGMVDIGTGITQIGRSSFHLYQELFQNDKLVAKARTVIVQVSNETRKSVAIEQSSREALSFFMIKGESN